jgi:hypothetical protein
MANEKGVHYAMELSGHRSDRYIWRYVNMRPRVWLTPSTLSMSR